MSFFETFSKIVETTGKIVAMIDTAGRFYFFLREKRDILSKSESVEKSKSAPSAATERAEDTPCE